MGKNVRRARQTKLCPYPVRFSEGNRSSPPLLTIQLPPKNLRAFLMISHPLLNDSTRFFPIQITCDLNSYIYDANSLKTKFFRTNNAQQTIRFLLGKQKVPRTPLRKGAIVEVGCLALLGYAQAIMLP